MPGQVEGQGVNITEPQAKVTILPWKIAELELSAMHCTKWQTRSSRFYSLKCLILQDLHQLIEVQTLQVFYLCIIFLNQASLLGLTFNFVLFENNLFLCQCTHPVL